ncbi:hypothetical protein [Serratia ureilytica]|uniref:hypothetical protein n=1 Tax=Serratia ureilytica TaxID=300181 RepID=UPI0018D916B3|nr:hypothetical protein [Serratia ureilytica]MBH2650408.1 hypothetical protein [Serratia ureilytica]
MDNKLSKPVAWTDAEELRDLSKHRCAYMFIIDSANPYHDPRRQQMLYSQEYVSALTQRIEELEDKLAAPVRLPLPYSPDPWMSPDPDGTWLDKEDVKKSIRAAGFVVELCSACNERYCGNCAHAHGAKVQ